MFGIGSTELIIILVVALIVIGPQKLPDLMRTLGKGLSEFRNMSNDVKRTLDQEIATADEDRRKQEVAAMEEKRRKEEQELAAKKSETLEEETASETSTEASTEEAEKKSVKVEEPVAEKVAETESKAAEGSVDDSAKSEGDKA
ncbi:Sec-independent protein translocase protein TatB [Maridesulfovibrio bastinii]|uniref:Sec-independent protein translocase protein TatB n=1 Tax=Maridesulfovibrio bastinii TaxID=47157 RepID=UPI0004223CAB|nr:Sec-independent protein translocase protein TatB [Maridesulfovibrio bastinii]